VGTESDWSITACGADYTLGIKTNGTIWSWGWNRLGQLGLGDTMDRNTPTQSGLLIPNPPASLTANIFSSSRIDLSWVDFAYNEAGFKIERKIRLTGIWQQIATVGSNVVSYSDISETGFAPLTTYCYRVRAYNTIGNSIYTNERIIALSGDWSVIEAGAYHTIVIKNNGTIWSCGSNDSGELGMGDLNIRNTFSQIGTNSDWVSIAAGGDRLGSHTIARKTNGTIWAWGYNEFGQLGIEITDNRDTPTPVGTSSDWSVIKTGCLHTTALKMNGNLRAWGQNDSGQLGLGDNEYRTTPSRVGTQSDWSAIAAGGYHTIARKTNNTIWVWGQNTYGQLGLGDSDTGTDRNTPAQLGSNSDWLAVSGANLSTIAAGANHTLAIKTNATLWAWGCNNYGQLGLGDTMDRNTPTQIGLDSDWYIILTGNIHTLARKTNGTLWAWGYNGSGQLGDGTLVDKTTPCQIGSASDWLAIAGGDSHTIARKTNGTIWVWGFNGSGQLGLGDNANRYVPTLVGE
jgi:alpha-tubulin suppressor-like RCC1 family protein